MSTIPAEELHALVAEIFRAHGVPDSDAAIVAASLVHANLRGTDSHGVMRVPHYVKRLRAGSICPAPQETFTQTGPCTGMLGGGDGLGHVNALHAMHEAVRMARESGLALVAVRNSSHCGALSFLVQPALEAGLIGIALTQTDAGTLPYGGVKPFFGTNPLCYAFPSASGVPVILDMATSTVAGGHVYTARAENRPIPDTWAVDADGKPTTDPHKAVYWTPMAGAKGFGLAAAVDCLTGILAGGTFGPHLTPMYSHYDQKRGLSHLVGAIDFRRFGGSETFLGQVAQMVDDLHAAPTAEGVTQILAPGEPEHRRELERRANGIPILDSLLEELRSLLPSAGGTAA